MSPVVPIALAVVALLVCAVGAVAAVRARRDVRRRRVAGALVRHARGEPAPDGDDPVADTAVALVEEAHRTIGRRDEALRAERARTTALQQRHVALLRAVRHQVGDPLRQLLASGDVPDPAAAAVVDHAVSTLDDAVAVELADAGDLTLAPEPTDVATVLVEALEPLARTLAPVPVVVEGPAEVPVVADVARLGGALERLAWGSVGSLGDELCVRLDLDDDAIRIHLPDVDGALVGGLARSASVGIVGAHGGHVDLEDGCVVRLPVAPWQVGGDLAVRRPPVRDGSPPGVRTDGVGAARQDRAAGQ